MRLSTLVGYRKNWPCYTTHLYMFRLILAFTMRSRGWRIPSLLSFVLWIFRFFLLRRISNALSYISIRKKFSLIGKYVQIYRRIIGGKQC